MVRGRATDDEQAAALPNSFSTTQARLSSQQSAQASRVSLSLFLVSLFLFFPRAFFSCPSRTISAARLRMF
jgi:hypothetical protein